jgi:hypothetical protein
MNGRGFSGLFIFVAVAVLLTIASAQEIKDSPPSLRIYQNSATIGEVFKGVVYRESGKELYLDTTPCAPPDEKKIKPFVQPYVKTKTDEKVRCGKDTFQLVRVEKK